MNAIRPFHVLVCQDRPGGEALAKRYARCPGTRVTACDPAHLTAPRTGSAPACDLLDLHSAPRHTVPLFRACAGVAAAVALPIPFAGSPEEGEKLLRVLRKRGSVAWVRNLYLFEPACARLFELVGSGVLGPLHRIDCTIHDCAAPSTAGDSPELPRDTVAPFTAVLDTLLRLIPDAGDPTALALNSNDEVLSFSFSRGPSVTVTRLPAAPAGPDHWLIAGRNGTLQAAITPGTAALPAETGDKAGQNRVWLDSGGRRRDYPVPHADAATLFLATAILTWRSRQPVARLAPGPSLRAQFFLAGLGTATKPAWMIHHAGHEDHEDNT